MEQKLNQKGIELLKDMAETSAEIAEIIAENETKSK